MVGQESNSSPLVGKYRPKAGDGARSALVSNISRPLEVRQNQNVPKGLLGAPSQTVSTFVAWAHPVASMVTKRSRQYLQTRTGTASAGLI